MASFGVCKFSFKQQKLYGLTRFDVNLILLEPNQPADINGFARQEQNPASVRHIKGQFETPAPKVYSSLDTSIREMYLQ